MSIRMFPAAQIWATEGGSGEPVLLLLHGLGATGEVWQGIRPFLETHWPGRWIIPDLRGHGRSSHTSLYSFGQHAADMAGLIGEASSVFVVGHSMGGAVGLTLASGWFGVRVTGVIALGVKVVWTDAELAGVRERARRPVRLLDNREEALTRFLRVAGLEGLVSPDSEIAASGIVEIDGRYRLASDPAAVMVGAADMGSLLAAARGQIVLACGEHDHLVTIDQLRRLDPKAIELPGLGHNAHVEAPERIWRLIADLAGLS